VSLLADIYTRGYITGEPDRAPVMRPDEREPVAIDCHDVARGFWNAMFSDAEIPLVESLLTLPARAPFPATWLEWGIPLNRDDAASNPNGYRTVTDGALIVRDGEQSVVTVFCEGSPETRGHPVAMGSFVMLDNLGASTTMLAPSLTPIGVTLAEAAAQSTWWTDADRAEWQRLTGAHLARSYMASIGAGYVIATALRLMHVKNVDVVDKPTRKRGKKQRRLRPDQLIQWKTLEVRPGGVSESAGSGSGESLTAHHIVRGHFATYTADKPLFGKYVGTYWREAHARGDRKAGEVAKDYRVAA
jgi:hypothetical protein